MKVELKLALPIICFLLLGFGAFVKKANAYQAALVIEAEDATIRTIGGPTADGWCLWSNGTLGEYISIPAGGTYELAVRAYGSPLGGIWPDMELSVDGVPGEMVTVDSAEYTDYVFQIELTAGVHALEVSFLNDAWDPGTEDRNLYLDRFSILSPPGVDKSEIVSPLAVVEAENATIRTIGGPTDDGWCLWSNGTLGEYISIAEAGTYEVEVQAYGSPLGGIWPHMAFDVDGVVVEIVAVNNAAYTVYIFQIELTPGVHSLGVRFLNDAWNPGVEDRNLYLDRFTILRSEGQGEPPPDPDPGPEEAFACLNEAGPLELVSGFYNSDKFEPDVAPDKKFDARAASFEYPETISHAMVSLRSDNGGAPRMCWAGGYFTSALSWHDLDVSWDQSKNGYDDVGSNRGEMNNTSSATSYEDLMTWTGLHVYNMHDGIRTNNTYNNWTVQHVWFDYVRDDCIENDLGYSGTVYDVLFDGCYTGFSARPGTSGEGAGETITMDKVLLRLEPMPYPYKWDTKSEPMLYLPGYGDIPFGYAKLFKLESGSQPDFQITNSVFLFEYDAEEDLFPPKHKVTACSDNTVIWLDGPSTAPLHLLDDFPGCFRIITAVVQGKAFWKSKAADWHARHPEVGAARKPAISGAYSWPRFPPE
jgi:hypothetical protein